MPKTKKEKIIKVGSFITNTDISQSRFRHYTNEELETP